MHLHEEYIKRNKINHNIILRNSKNILFFKDSVFDFLLICKDSSKRPFLYKFLFYKKGLLKRSLDITWENYERFIIFISNFFKSKIIFDENEIRNYCWLLFVLKNQNYFLENTDREFLFDSLSGDFKLVEYILCDNEILKLNWEKNIKFAIKSYAFWMKMVS